MEVRLAPVQMKISANHSPTPPQPLRLSNFKPLLFTSLFSPEFNSGQGLKEKQPYKITQGGDKILRGRTKFLEVDFLSCQAVVLG
jgi:hypothetical protein